jgi:hypothetical protein
MAVSTASSSQPLGRIFLFRGLPPEAVARVQAYCSLKHYEPGELILDYLDQSGVMCGGRMGR